MIELAGGRSRVLIVGASWVGDLVMSQVLFKVLAQRYPGLEIDVLAPGFCEPLLQRMPEVSHTWVFSVGHGEVGLKRRYQLGAQLRGHQYDQAILLPNSFKSALVPWFAKIPVRTGWRGEMRYGLLNDLRILDKARLPYMIQRFAALGYAPQAQDAVLDMASLPKPSLKVSSEKQMQVLDELNLTLDLPVLVICPGAEFGEAKRWPPEHYAAVSQACMEKGWQVWAIGSAKEQAVVAHIENQLKGYQTFHALAGRTNLSQAIDLMACARAIVTNDSGLMHIAAALSKPLVAVYGSTSDQFTPPLSDQAQVLRLDLECQPCFKRVCPLGHTQCLKHLMPERVLQALDNRV